MSTFHFASEDDKLRALNAFRVRGVDTGYESMSELVSDLVITWVAVGTWSAGGGTLSDRALGSRRSA